MDGVSYCLINIKIHSGVRQGCIMSLWLFNVYMDTVMKEGREWRYPALLYAGDFLCVKSEEDLMAMVERFVEECRRRVLKVNAGKS